MKTLVALLALACAASAVTLTRKLGREPGTTGASPCDNTDKCGTPLLLTPLIEAGKIAEAQNASRVKQMRFQRVESHAGYLTVDAAHDSNLFFWYFRTTSKDPNAPVVLWLQGGPGASSMYGLFYENGPFRFRGRHVTRRAMSWHNNHHMIYIDNPVGTGFSFTNEGGYARNETVVGDQLYAALVQFFTLFPELQANPFFVTGESYAGKYVPAASYAIHKNNPQAKVKINLQGFAIGNGLCDPVNQLKYGDYIYQLGLVDEDGLNQVHAFESKGVKYIQNRQWQQAFDIFDTLINGDATPYKSLFHNLTGFDFYFNYLHTQDPATSQVMDKLFAAPEVRAALHVGATPFAEGGAVFENLKLDLMQSVAPWIGELLSHYRGLFYNGQLDIIVAYPLTESFLAALDFSAKQQFAQAPRRLWLVGGKLAGYAKTAGNLTEVLVRDAGHMVPGDQPVWAMDLITRFTSNKPFASNED